MQVSFGTRVRHTRFTYFAFSFVIKHGISILHITHNLQMATVAFHLVISTFTTNSLHFSMISLFKI